MKTFVKAELQKLSYREKLLQAEGIVKKSK